MSKFQVLKGFGPWEALLMDRCLSISLDYAMKTEECSFITRASYKISEYVRSCTTNNSYPTIESS